MVRFLQASVLLLASVVLLGCDHEHKVRMPYQCEIQVSVPIEPCPGPKTKIIVPNVETGRNLFHKFYDKARMTRWCVPDEVEWNKHAFVVMMITYTDKPCRSRTFYILKDRNGKWLDTGYGAVEYYDQRRGFPKYHYDDELIRKLEEWYDNHVPIGDRKR